jgi:hypothetical protein|nr:MAG TPA: Protein of unknown function (DUF2381) [Caudoviricetes sp.]
MSESTLQRELDEAKASATVTYWHLLQTAENLLKEIARLSSRNAQLMAENERQRVLLAALKREPVTPRTIKGGEDSRDLPKGVMVVSQHGDAWGRERDGWSQLYSYDLEGPEEELQEKFGPYTIVWEPKENAND